MAELFYTGAWTEQSIIQQVQHFANSDYTWSRLRETGSQLHAVRKAAVLIPLFVKDGDIYVWLTLRSKHLRKDPGDVAFPGGKQDREEDEIETCLREAQEEIGLSPTDVQIVAPIPPRMSRHKILVSPVIGIVNPDFKPEINTSEVEVAFSLPLRRFLSKDGHRSIPHEHNAATYNLPFFDDDVDGRLITTWGLTATLCVEVAMGMFERYPEFGLVVRLLDDFKIDPKNPFVYQVKYLEDYEQQLKSKF